MWVYEITMLKFHSTLYYNATQLFPDWIPAPEIRRTDADVTIIFIAPNSMRYRRRVIDPVFKATYPSPGPSLTNVYNYTYGADNATSVVACTEQYQICTSSGSCTPYTSLLPLQTNVTQLDLNAAQSVTATRLLYAISNANLYSSINGLGPEALRLYSGAYNLISPGVPQNQWQLEVEGWVQTNLAKWQALMVEYAHNTADLGTFGHLDGPNNDDDAFRTEWQRQCRQQMIANLAGYQNISVLGLVVIYGLGGLIILVSLFLKNIVFQFDGSWTTGQAAAKTSKSRERRIAWNIDGKYQSQRIALTTAGFTHLEGGSGDIPHLKTKLLSPLPIQAVLTGGDTSYVATTRSQTPGATTSAAFGGKSRWRKSAASKIPIVTNQAVSQAQTVLPTQATSLPQPASQTTHTKAKKASCICM